ncbi:MAG: prenyltransferase [Clostridiaceae bacterium]
MEKEDFEKLLSTRYENGADFWATPDGKLGIEKPFSTLSALLIMSELKVDKSHEALQGAIELVLQSIRDDGRVQPAPKGAMYPCHTALAAVALCKNGYCEDERVKKVLTYLLSSRYFDGGWRCNKFSYGRGPETEFSNPGVTLVVLDALRLAGMHMENKELDSAVETLLHHWTTKVPTGPCHFGIGTLFMQVEYPFQRYNLFYFVYVLSFYEKARKDERFLEALALLTKKLDSNHQMVVEKPNRKLENFSFCRKGEPSVAATERYLEILQNLTE